MTKRVEYVTLTKSGSGRLAGAMRVAEELLGGSVLAIVLATDGEAWIHFRPGVGAEVARLLSASDWNRIVRQAEEHCE